jgi:hypothetical protein
MCCSARDSRLFRYFGYIIIFWKEEERLHNHFSKENEKDEERFVEFSNILSDDLDLKMELSYLNSDILRI